MFFCMDLFLFCRRGFRFAFFSLHTLTLYFVHEMSAVLYLGLSSLKLKGDCVAVSQWMYFPSGHCENPS